MKDSAFCVMHDERYDPSAMGKSGVEAREKLRKIENPVYMPVESVEDQHEDDQVIPLFQTLINNYQKDKNLTVEAARMLVQAGAALDRAMERRANRGADVQRIEVTYTNDWRT